MFVFLKCHIIFLMNFLSLWKSLPDAYLVPPKVTRNEKKIIKVLAREHLVNLNDNISNDKLAAHGTSTV